MTQAELLADALTGLFSNPEAGWYTPLSSGIQGLDAGQAGRVPAERFNSVWGVVNHVRYWQEYMLLRLQGLPIDRVALGGKNGWPAISENEDQTAWEADQARMLAANQKLAEYILTLSDETLIQPIAPGKSSPYQVIQGLIAHNGYHTCEVISIRHMLGLWLERT